MREWVDRDRVAPSCATKLCTSRYQAGSVSAVGVRNQEAPSNKPGLACAVHRLGSRKRMTTTNRDEGGGAAQTAALVEPTSVTAHPSELASSIARTVAPS